MKKILSAPLLALALTGAGMAQTPADLPDADPAIWSVKDEDTTIYLFGTFHLLDGRRDWFNDEVKAAFEESDELVLEAILPENPAELQPLIMRYAVDPEGRTLSSQLTDAQNARLRETLAGMGVPAEAFDRFEPWFVSMTLASLAAQKLGVTGEHGPEKILSRAAVERGIPVSELEGLQYQLELFDGMEPEAQLAQLGVTLENFEDIADQMAPMLAAWSSGEVDQLVEIMNASLEEHPEVHKLIFAERNAKWADWLAGRLDQPGTVFVAVGAGHLAGDDSVQAMLEARGITSNRLASR